jgi:phosphatidylethanolamine-binding protein (PEBP) family uncharacterized protein
LCARLRCLREHGRSEQQRRRDATVQQLLHSMSADERARRCTQRTRCGANQSERGKWNPGCWRSFAVIMDDPDAPNGTFTHWLAYDVPAGKGELEIDRGKTLRNGFGRDVGSLATRPNSAG